MRKVDFAFVFPLLLLLAPIFYAADSRPQTKPASGPTSVCEVNGPQVCGARQVFVIGVAQAEDTLTTQGN